ncbi:hypothetical protein MASR2M48_10190 [Spirochaetota bacterium]
MKKDSMLYVVLFTFIACALFVVVLAVANEGTKDLVAINKAFAVQSAVLGAFGIPFTDAADAASKYTIICYRERRRCTRNLEIDNRRNRIHRPTAIRSRAMGYHQRHIGSYFRCRAHTGNTCGCPE